MEGTQRGGAAEREGRGKEAGKLGCHSCEEVLVTLKQCSPGGRDT